jgi:2-keto-4-pentenoate hydratase
MIDALYEGARRGRLDVDPTTFDIGNDAEAGLHAQLDVLARWEADGEQVAGWKVGLTSGRARDAMGQGYRPFGYVLASRTFRSGATIPLCSIGTCRVEPELCLTMGSELDLESVDLDAARAAVASVAPSFEINELRVRPGSAPLAVLLADNLAQWGIVVGDEVDPPTGRLVDTTVEVACDTAHEATVCPGDTMDDPFLSVARLAVQLHRFGRSLRPGDRVITGAFADHSVERPGVWTAAFSGVGSVRVTFTGATDAGSTSAGSSEQER